MELANGGNNEPHAENLAIALQVERGVKPMYTKDQQTAFIFVYGLYGPGETDWVGEPGVRWPCKAPNRERVIPCTQVLNALGIRYTPG
jgi:hypothetical protein